MSDPIRILLDEGVPERLRFRFSGSFAVETVRFRGWTGMRNGDLLRAAEDSFDAFVTVDKRLPYQHNVRVRSIAVVAIDAVGTALKDIVPLMPGIEQALRRVKPGEVIIIRS